MYISTYAYYDQLEKGPKESLKIDPLVQSTCDWHDFIKFFALNNRRQILGSYFQNFAVHQKKLHKTKTRFYLVLVLCNFIACKAKFQKYGQRVWRCCFVAKNKIEIMLIACRSTQWIYLLMILEIYSKSIIICVGWDMGTRKYRTNGLKGESYR